jgi:hypothetical protein
MQQSCLSVIEFEQLNEQVISERILSLIGVYASKSVNGKENGSRPVNVRLLLSAEISERWRNWRENAHQDLDTHIVRKRVVREFNVINSHI